MFTIDQLIEVAEAYKAAAGVERDQTVSYRVFRDTKKLSSLKSGAGITLGRLNAALTWFMENWPDGHDLPVVLQGQRQGAA